KKLLNNPLVTTRGYILVNESYDLIKEIEHEAREIILRELKKEHFNLNNLKNEVINELMPLCEEKTGRIPIILPIIMTIK
ncbi:MAG: hypothetical protein IKI04_00370, partial [Bacilli bacterium]|nr:hypothetical protein [Bacilli bacterium]